MPDYPWQLDGWEARKKATWPLEWEQKCAPAGHEPYVARYRIQHVAGRWQREILIGKKWQRDVYITNHEAACLIREHWRVWLAERGLFICPAPEHELGAYTVCGEDVDFPPNFLTYDDAQAAAIDALMAEQEQK